MAETFAGRVPAIAAATAIWRDDIVPDAWANCPGAPVSRLRDADWVMVSVEPPLPSRIRSAPGWRPSGRPDDDEDRPVARAVAGNDAGTPIPAVRTPYSVSPGDPEVPPAPVGRERRQRL